MGWTYRVHSNPNPNPTLPYPALILTSGTSPSFELLGLQLRQGTDVQGVYLLHFVLEVMDPFTVHVEHCVMHHCITQEHAVTAAYLHAAHG